jgi:hypothetical protein
MTTKYLTLKSIPTSVRVGNVTVRGEVLDLLPNEMVVEINFPSKRPMAPCPHPLLRHGEPCTLVRHRRRLANHASIRVWQAQSLRNPRGALRLQ